MFDIHVFFKENRYAIFSKNKPLFFDVGYITLIFNNISMHICFLSDANSLVLYCLSTHVDMGTLRETFSYAQLRNVSEVLLPKKGDFMVNREYLFEVGARVRTSSK